MKLIKNYIMGLVLMAIGLQVNAQNYTVKGHVYDLENHAPVAEALIKVVNQPTATETNEEGFFKLNTKQQQGQLLISVLGYKTQIVHYNSNQDVLNIQMEVNSQLLNKVIIEAFNTRKTIKETAASVAYVSGKQLNKGSGASMQMALNRIPGVRMDQSNLGDSRISIRGNGVRSPWGMRNIKVYINGIPLTETDGTTRIEALDIPALGSAQVIKGPASSIYGAATGGIIKFHLKRSAYQEQSLEASGLVGSFGLQRESLTYRYGADKFNAYVSYGDQYYAGYREHSSDKRRFFSGNFQFFPSNDRTITLLISRTSQEAQIPGALTKAQVKEDRRQATVANRKNKTGRIQTWTRVGVSQDYDFNDNLSNTTSAYTYFYDLHHPLIFGIIRNFYQSYGGRTVFKYTPDFKTLPTTFTFGAEYNQAKTKGTIYVNNHGKEGAMFSNTDYKNTMFTVFLQTETQIGNIANLILGLSYNGMKYDVTDYLHPAKGGVKKFDPEATPRIALRHDFGDWLSLYTSVSFGFSPPTTTQIKNADRSINKEIQAVRGVNYEIGAKGFLFGSQLSYSLALYDMEMTGELIAQSISPGITIYHNSGQTSHKGIELGLSYQAVKNSADKAFTKFNPYLAVTYSDFTVEEYEVLNAQNQVVADYAGNKIVGVAPWVVSAGFMFDTRLGLYGNANIYFSDKYALNDANTDYNPAYSVVNAKVGYQTDLGKHFELNLYAGIKNIANTKYSSFTQLNARSYGGQPPAYFNPAAPRNWYSGLELKFKF